MALSGCLYEENTQPVINVNFPEEIKVQLSLIGTCLRGHTLDDKNTCQVRCHKLIDVSDGL